jgi:4-diphosphocytidyl-2-C-methyl-D-erythritol kinase
MTALRDTAPAKVNLCLFLGPTRESDGRHELVSVFQPVGLVDDVELEPGGLGAAADRVVCPGVDGENLAATALRRFRERTGWTGAPVRLTIEKRIPIAAGMAGGSADAGAALRLAARAAGIDDDQLLRHIAAELGADVAAQVRPGRYLATGAGERLTPLPAPRPYGVLVIPSRARLPTADVYREADRQGLPRDPAELASKLRQVSTMAGDLPDHLVVNDLEPAARALCPAVGEGLAAMRAAGADRALVCGSGPTVAGLFRRAEAARAAAVALGDRSPRPILAEPWRAPAAEAAA